MIVPTNSIGGEWSSRDIALFAGMVEAVTHACDESLKKHGRLNDPVLYIIAKACITAAKSMVLTSGLHDHATSAVALEAFNAMLREEIAGNAGLAEKVDAVFIPKERH